MNRPNHEKDYSNDEEDLRTVKRIFQIMKMILQNMKRKNLL